MTRRIVLLFLVLSGTALAQEERRAVHKDVNIVDFEKDLEVVGDVVKPGVTLIRQPPKPTFNPLIELRADFTPEMDQSAAQVR